MILLIDDLPLVSLLILGTTLLPGVLRNKTRCHALLLNLSTVPWLLQLLNYVGFARCSKIWEFFSLLLQSFGVIMFLPWQLLLNLVFHTRTKHLEVDYHFVREKVLRRDLQVKYIATGDQLADIFTKSLSTSQFVYLRSKIMVSVAPMVLRGDVRDKVQMVKTEHKSENKEEDEV